MEKMDVAIPAQTICSLFSGIGGLDESVRLAAPRIKTVVYVERESYAVATLGKKMEEVRKVRVWSIDVNKH